MHGWKIAFVVVALAALMPAAAQMRMSQVQPVARPATQVQAIEIDYQAQYRQEAEKNKALRAENASLKSQLDSYTSRAGSRVSAYCETPTLSRNTAGASNDCSASGFGCEPVSGLCRTVAHASSECAAGYVYCSVRNNCVRTAEECN